MSYSDRTYSVFQTNPDDGSELIATVYTEKDAAEEVDRINANLALAGVPTDVSCAYYV